MISLVLNPHQYLTNYFIILRDATLILKGTVCDPDQSLNDHGVVHTEFKGIVCKNKLLEICKDWLTSNTSI